MRVVVQDMQGVPIPMTASRRFLWMEEAEGQPLQVQVVELFLYWVVVEEELVYFVVEMGATLNVEIPDWRYSELLPVLHFLS